MFQTALVVALANVQIPVLLGDLVNVVADYGRGSSSDAQQFWNDIAGPAFQLVKIYIVQVSFVTYFIQSTAI